MSAQLMSISPLRRRSSQERQAGFTLIELMVVVAVIALVTSAIAPMVFSTMSSTRLTSAGQSLASQISLAHQLAVSGNQEIEVRFYEYEDTTAPGTGKAFRAVAMVRSASMFSTAGAAGLGQQISDTFYLPSGIVFGSGAKLSPPLSKLSPEQDKEGIIKKASGASYRAFHFFPDGSTDLPMHQMAANQCYFTMGEERLIADGAIPKNFFAVQVDPNTGRTSTYRP